MATLPPPPFSKTTQEKLTVSDAVVGRADLQKKDRGELQTIITALGGKPSSRAKKDDLITMVLELTGTIEPSAASSSSGSSSAGAGSSNGAPRVESDAAGASGNTAAAEAADDAESDAGHPSDRSRGETESDDGAGSEDAEASIGFSSVSAGRGRGNPGGSRGRQQGGRATNPQQNSSQQNSSQQKSADQQRSSGQAGGGSQNGGGQGSNSEDPNQLDTSDNANAKSEPAKDEDEDGNRRRRRRGRGRDREEEVVNIEPQAVGGNLDLRDEGYGFLRVDGALPSPEDVYVPLKTVRIYGLRKGDHVSGTARPAARNERNAALHSLDLINDKDPAGAKDRPRFDQLTAVFPSEALPLEAEGSTGGRIMDLIAPLGKGQRALIVAPPETGASTLLADIAVSIQANHPESHLIVMLLDDRPEEVTVLSRRLDGGEIVASPFDRPPEEQVAVAEMAVERAKRLVEEGQDVVLLVDGITSLVRAYNLSAPGGGRLLGGCVDASAIYPAKKFFGAARALEEGGSLTMVATLVAETGSAVDEVILDEFRGTATAEIRLSRHLADRGVHPAIDPDASFNRAQDQLFDAEEAALVEKLWKSVAGDDPLTTMQNLTAAVEKSSSNAEMLGALK